MDFGVNSNNVREYTDHGRSHPLGVVGSGASYPPVEENIRSSASTPRYCEPKKEKGNLSDLATKSYWESRYRTGGNSGAGSYGRLAVYKASFLNRFVARHRISSVAELGCGDGEQLRRSAYPVYTGYDIAEAAVNLCRTKFAEDSTKAFYCLTDVRTLEPADLCLSLDVIYHPS